MTIASIAAIALVVLLIVFSKASPRAAASEFMSALAERNVDKLTALSIIQNDPPSEIRKKWQATLDDTKTFTFYWEITASTQGEKNAAVKMEVTQDVGSPTAYPQHFELPLSNINGVWKVNVPEISREMYPYLPQ